MEAPQGITFQGMLTKLSTTIDGGWRITLDIGNDFQKELLQLAVLKDSPLQCAFIPIECLDSIDGDF